MYLVFRGADSGQDNDWSLCVVLTEPEQSAAEQRLLWRSADQQRIAASPPSCSRPSPPLTFYHQQWEKNVIITQFCWFVSKGWDVCSNFFGYDDCYNSVSNVGLLVRLFNARISFLQLGRQDKTSLETSHITIHDTFVSEAPWCC